MLLLHMMDQILAISPLDGRYREKVEGLSKYFSEFALIKYRVRVEIEWFLFLCNEVKLPGTRVLSRKEEGICRAIFKDFDVMDAKRVKEFEAKTNHDVKAVEYFLKEHFKAYPKLAELSEFIHFGCTSEDINNLAYGLMISEGGRGECLPLMTGLIEALYGMAKKYKSIPMLSRTHGQPASPTTIGKELVNFVSRLEEQIKLLKSIPWFGKMNGAVGNFNAHMAAYPNIDWLSVSQRFVEKLGFVWNVYTTQIEPHDMYAALFDNLARFNTILIDVSRDMWFYINLGYFKQKLRAGEVGSSTMPHKINPIDFENAEGNLGLANAIFRHLSEKLPISRLQRDLSDSTVLRNIGTGFGYAVLAYRSLLRGFLKLEIDNNQLKKDLDMNWEVLAEAIQTVLRKHKISNAYEKLKKLTRGKKLGEKELRSFVSKLKIPEADKKHLLKLTPSTYTGLAEKLVNLYKPKFSS